MSRILLVDLSERELKIRMELEARLQRLTTIDDTKSSSGGLTSSQVKEKASIQEQLDGDASVDTFYQAVVAAITQKDWDPEKGDHVLKHGLMPSQSNAAGDATDSKDPGEHNRLNDSERELIAVCGLMQVDNATDEKRPNFTRRVTEALGEFRQYRQLFENVYNLLSRKYGVKLQTQISRQLVDSAIIGCIRPNQSISSRDNPTTAATARAAVNALPAGNETVSVLSGKNVAATVRRLVEDKVSPDDPWLKSSIERAYEMQTGVTSGAPPSAIEIMLPDLEQDVDVEIVRENLHAIQAHYFAYQLEEMRMFQVVEKIVDLFRQGMLPLGRGKAGDYLYRYYKTASERITEQERRDLYMRAFGAPGGDANGSLANREFNELWLRFVSSVSSFSRQLTVEKLLRNSVPMAVSQEQVRKSGRDLAANLSLHGYGIAYFAATELQTSILEFRDVLSDPEVRSAFGARDMWQVIDQVNVNYLGGARNTNRYRTQARAGAIIIRWLANNPGRLTGSFGNEVISINAITNPQLRSMGSDQPTVTPSDWDLVQAAEQWLAVGGVQDASVEQYSQSVESPTMTSKPIEVPQMARDVLDSAGISLPGM